jgi:hypothetical protein
VLVHISFRNRAIAHVTLHVMPKYKIRDGGQHGSGLGSLEDIGVDGKCGLMPASRRAFRRSRRFRRASRTCFASDGVGAQDLFACDRAEVARPFGALRGPSTSG